MFVKQRGMGRSVSWVMGKTYLKMRKNLDYDIFFLYNI